MKRLARCLGSFLGVLTAVSGGCAHDPTIQIDGHTLGITAVVDGVVENYRQSMFLAAAPDMSVDGQNELVIARVLYQQNRDHLDLLAEAIAGNRGAADSLVSQVMRPDLRDADRLAFYDVVIDLPVTPKVQQAQERLNLIQRSYEEKMHAILERLGQSRGVGAPVPEPWEDYTAFLQQRYNRDQLLARYAMYTSPRGTRAVRWVDNEAYIVGSTLPRKTVALTFDDGPHRRYTDAVVEILDRYHIKAVFFEVGANVRRLPERSKRILRAGHTIGNHGWTHAYFPKLDETSLVREIEDTSNAITTAISTKPVLFRAPYGAESDEVLAQSKRFGMKAVLWNIDSLDWKDPVPESIAERVVQALKRNREHGICLFHDTHRRTVTALPMVIDRLLADGYTFLEWNGSAFVVPSPH